MVMQAERSIENRNQPRTVGESVFPLSPRYTEGLSVPAFRLSFKQDQGSWRFYYSCSLYLDDTDRLVGRSLRVSLLRSLKAIWEAIRGAIVPFLSLCTPQDLAG